VKFKLTTILIFVLGLALFIRLVGITKVPISINWDEAGFGYSAYSLLITGKDEYGVVMPLQFKSVGDYKNPLYVYLLVLPIKIWKLNEFTVRLPPAILGSLAVMAATGIAYEILRNKKWTLIYGVMMAFSPWQIQFSRAGADVGVSTFFVVMGIWLFLRRRQTLSAIMLAGSAYAYFSDKLFSPLIAFGLAKLKNWKFLFVFSLVFVGALISGVTKGHQGKVWMTTLLSYQQPIEDVQKLQRADSEWEYKMFHNQVWLYGKMFLDRYFNHFSPKFLFTQGPEDNRQRIWGMGMMLWPEFFLGLVAVFFGDKFKLKHKYFLIFWTLLAPLPSAITKDAVHARRALDLVYPLMIWYVGSAQFLWLRIKSKWKIILAGLFGLAWCLALLRYLVSYYVWTPIRTAQGSGGWQYGYKQLVSTVSPRAKYFDKVIIDTTYQGPYIFFLFYLNYPPDKYQKQANLIIENPLALGEGSGFDNYVFREVYWPRDRGLTKILIAAPPEKIPEKDIDNIHFKLVDKIYFPDGTPAWFIVESI